MIIVIDSGCQFLRLVNARILLGAGILSSALYAAMSVFVPLAYPGYDSASMWVSEISAIGAPTRTVWVVLGYGYTFLFLAFAWGVWQSAGENKALHVTGILLLIYAGVSLLWPLAPMHTREALAAGEKNLFDTWHLIFAGMAVLLMTAAMAIGAFAFGKGFRIYSFLTIACLLLFGMLTGQSAPHVEKNLPTPLIGVWERINIGVFLAWVVALALLVQRKVASTTSQS
jgi:hypothetical protein